MTQIFTANITTDFHHEYEAERERWLRDRFLWYAGIVCGLAALSIGLSGLRLTLGFGDATPERASTLRVKEWVDFGSAAISGMLYVGALLYVRRQGGTREQILRLAFALIVAAGIVELMSPVLSHFLNELLVDRPSTGTGDARHGMPLNVALHGAGRIFLIHAFACVFLPWTAKESIRPLVPLLVLNAILTLLSGSDWSTKLLVICASPTVGVPGALFCWWRHGAFRERFAYRVLRGRYSEMRDEMNTARQIHESLFPNPVKEGGVRLSYTYEPMRAIGGDYLFASFCPAPDPRLRPLTVVVLDVTGHGIPAALTVNRLHGELERLYAENPEMRPGDALRLLNRYVHLTLAGHSVYVTALIARADPAASTLDYASGGHPPAFLRAVDGSLDQLASTAFVLGACPDPDFNPDPKSLRFGPGDSLIVYTDGASEARNRQRKMLGVIGLQRIIINEKRDPDGGWSATVARAVAAHRAGPPSDDMLVIELYRPLTLDPAVTMAGITRVGLAAARTRILTPSRPVTRSSGFLRP